MTKQDRLNQKIEKLINDIPWVQNLGMFVTVGDGHTGFTGLGSKPFCATPLMFAEIEGMIHGIKYWEEENEKAKDKKKRGK